MFLFLKLLLAHLLGDFVFQPFSWVKDKEEKKIRSPKLYLHIAIHAFLVVFFLQFNLKEYWLGYIIITLSHYIFDLIKLSYQKKKTKRIWFFIDQILHISILAFAALIYTEIHLSWQDFFTDKTVLLLIAILLTTNVSAIIIKMIITQWNPESKNKNDDSLAKAGRYIGILERLFVFVLVVTDHWEAIGFLLAAKSVFRFGDLTSSKDRKLTEYILIGTLLSFGLAILIGIIYSYLATII